MAKTFLAELVMRWLCGRSRAAEIVGDLLEQGQASQRVLWSAVLHLCVSGGWRWAAAFVSVVLSSLFALVRFVAAGPGLHAELSRLAWMRWGMPCMLAALCAWAMTLLSAFRFGPRDRHMLVGLGLCAVCLALACDAGSPHFEVIVVVALTGTAIACFAVPALRRPCLTLLAAGGTYAAVFVLLEGWIRVTTTSSHPFLAAQFFGYWLLSLTAAASVLLRVREVLERLPPAAV